MKLPNLKIKLKYNPTFHNSNTKGLTIGLEKSNYQPFIP